MVFRLSALTICLALLCSTTSGCAALLDAGRKEALDHGRHARYENKNFGEHFLDSLLEVDEDDGCHDRGDRYGRHDRRSHTHTTIVAEHG